jgi:hypothetical protein
MDNIREKIEDFFWEIKYVFFRVVHWIRFRTYEKHHVVRTGLPPGYTDVTDKMLHANFNMLVDFIEIEKAWMEYICHRQDISISWMKRLLYKCKFRSPELGLSYLKWEMELEGKYNTRQRDAAFEQFKLYDWWKNVRPNRPDPFDNFPTFGNLKDTSKKTMAQYKKASKQVHKICQEYNKEDEQMLIRLMKIREELWT